MKKTFTLKEIALGKHLIPGFKLVKFNRLNNYDYYYSGAELKENGKIKLFRIGEDYIHNVEHDPEDIAICRYEREKKVEKTPEKTYADRLKLISEMFPEKKQGLSYNLVYKLGFKI